MKEIGFILIILLLFPSLLLAKREHPERWYQEQWCEAHSGQIEVVLPDGHLLRLHDRYPCHRVRFRRWMGQSYRAKLILCLADRKKTWNCPDTGINKRQEILDPLEHNYWALCSADWYLEYRKRILLDFVKYKGLAPFPWPILYRSFCPQKRHYSPKIRPFFEANPKHFRRLRRPDPSLPKKCKVKGKRFKVKKNNEPLCKRPHR